jgi:hypothetical protein
MASPFNKKPFKMYDVTECSKTRRGFKRSHFEFMTSQNVQKRGVAKKEAILNL